MHLEPKIFWIKRTPSKTAWSDSWALVFYNLAILLRGVRLVLGLDVRPAAIKVACSDLPDHMPEALSGLPLTLGAETTRLGFDRALLAGHVGKLPVPVDPPVYQSLSSIDGESVTLCLLGLLSSDATDRLADRAARAFGVSRRSYQRHLRELGTNHRDLVSDARLKLALELLADNAWTVTQIAQELGYRHQGDFTRFFQYRTGLSPREVYGKLPIS